MRPDTRGTRRALPARLLASSRARLALLAALLASGSAVALIVGGPSAEGIERAVRGLGPAGPIAFVLLYAALTVLLVPGSVITAVGGALFGVGLGTLLAVIGASLGATAAFGLGRRLGRAEVEALAGRRVGSLDRWLGRRGFVAVLYLRLVPVVPFNVFNYVAGVTALRLRDYVLGTLLGIIPGAFAFAALGGSIRDPKSPTLFLAAGLVLLLAVGGPLVERLRRRRPGRPSLREDLSPRDSEETPPAAPGEGEAPTSAR